MELCSELRALGLKSELSVFPCCFSKRKNESPFCFYAFHKRKISRNSPCFSWHLEWLALKTHTCKPKIQRERKCIISFLFRSRCMWAEQALLQSTASQRKFQYIKLIYLKQYYYIIILDQMYCSLVNIVTKFNLFTEKSHGEVKSPSLVCLNNLYLEVQDVQLAINLSPLLELSWSLTRSSQMFFIHQFILVCSSLFLFSFKWLQNAHFQNSWFLIGSLQKG